MKSRRLPGPVPMSRSVTCSRGSSPRASGSSGWAIPSIVRAARPKGNAERGQAVFATSPAAQCETCHKLGPIGEAVGPDLSKIGTKYDKAAMLKHILEPSRTIDPQYVSYLVETKDGQVVTGVVTERTDAAIVLKDVQGKTVKIPRNQVASSRPGASLMPELLLRDLTAQQAADLLEFLSGQK